MLFAELPQSGHCDDERSALFHLIAHKCRGARSAIEVMPSGVGFFKTLMYQRAPDLAYYAASFLLDHLQAVQPVEYRAVLAQLVARARQRRDPSLITDTYQQVRAILELNEEMQASAAAFMATSPPTSTPSPTTTTSTSTSTALH